MALKFVLNPLTGEFDTVSVESTTSGNSFVTILGDVGSTTANTTTDTLTIVGGQNCVTTITGDVLTIDVSTGAAGSQNIFTSIFADAGSTTANTQTDSLSILGGNGCATTITGDVLTIDVSITSALISDMTEAVQDISGAFMTGTSGVAFSYQDVTGVAAFTAVPSQIDHNQLLNYTTTQHFTIAQISVTSAQISDLTETVEDLIADAHTSSSSVTFTYNDTDGSYTLAAVPGGIDHNQLLNYTTTQHFTIAQISITSAQVSDLTETVEDLIADAHTSSSSVTFTYNDTDGSYTFAAVPGGIDHNQLLNYTTTQHFTIAQISITSAQVSDLTESVEDIVAGEITVGSSKLTGTYNDTDGTYSIDIGTLNLDHLADVSISGATTGQVLMFTTTGWVNASLASGSGMAGPGSSTKNAAAYFDTTSGNTVSASTVVMITSTGMYLNTTAARIFFLTSSAYIYSNSSGGLVLSANILDISLSADFNANYIDIDNLAAPASPAAGTRRMYVDSTSGKLSVRTSAGTTVSLEEVSVASVNDVLMVQVFS